MHPFAVLADRDHPELPGAVVRAAPEIALHHNTAADAGAERNADKIFIFTPRAAPAFAQCSAVGVILGDNRQVRQL